MARGYCGIGIVNVKSEVNVGSLLRSAYAFGADFSFTIGRRYKHQKTDTYKVPRHLPLWHFITYEDFLEHIPYRCPIIGVEMQENAILLQDFVHPHQAVYILGPEDGCIPQRVQKACMQVVKIDTRFCLNVATAASIVLYDRFAKGGKQ